jgi:hypothetical protein
MIDLPPKSPEDVVRDAALSDGITDIDVVALAKKGTKLTGLEIKQLAGINRCILVLRGEDLKHLPDEVAASIRIEEESPIVFPPNVVRLGKLEVTSDAPVDLRNVRFADEIYANGTPNLCADNLISVKILECCNVRTVELPRLRCILDGFSATAADTIEAPKLTTPPKSTCLRPGVSAPKVMLEAYSMG